MVEIHFPGYNYCGPGTDLSKNKRPVSEADEKCRIHDLQYNEIAKRRKDYYYRYSYADEELLKNLENNKETAARIASWLFRLKKGINKVAGMEMIVAPRQRSMDEYFNAAKRRRVRNTVPITVPLAIADKPYQSRRPNHNTIMAMSQFSRIHGRYRPRRKRRRTGKKKDSFYKKVLKVINPVKVFITRKIDRALGVQNKADYINIGRHIGNGSGTPVEYSPGCFDLITNTLNNTQTKLTASVFASWTTQEGYYTRETHKWLISNNSNVSMKFEVYYVKHIGHKKDQPFFDFVTNTLTFDSTGGSSYFTSTGVTKVNRVAAANGPDFYTEPQYNLMTDKYALKTFADKFKIKKGKSYILNPGQTTTVKYRQKKYRYWNVSRLFSEDAVPVKYQYPDRCVEVYIRYVGDILPDKVDSKLAGINAGDVTIDHRVYVQTLTKMNQVNNKYIENADENESSTTLKVFGFDNNSAADAV